MEEAEKNPKGVIKSHYALEMFCENLGKNKSLIFENIGFFIFNM